MPERRKYELTKPRTVEQMAGLKPNKAEDTSGDTVPLPAKVPTELKQWVQAHAQATGKSQSRIVREALELYRQTTAKNPD